MAAWYTESPSCQAYPHLVLASSVTVASIPPQTAMDHNENYTYDTLQYIPHATLYEEPGEMEISTAQYPVQGSDPQAPIWTWQPRMMPRHPGYVHSAVTSSVPSTMESLTSIESGGSSCSVSMMASSCTTNSSGDAVQAAPSLATFTQMDNDRVPLFNARISAQRTIFHALPYDLDTARAPMEFGDQASPPPSLDAGVMNASHDIVNERHLRFYSTFQPPLAASAACPAAQTYQHHSTPQSAQVTQEPLSNRCLPAANDTPVMNPQFIHYWLAQGSYPKQDSSTYPTPLIVRKCGNCDEVFTGTAARQNLWRHQHWLHGKRKVHCDGCWKGFGRSDALKKHMEKCKARRHDGRGEAVGDAISH